MVTTLPLLALADCAHCGLCPEDASPRAVEGAGPRTAELVVVGEAPGVTERAQGTPFIGPSGKLLWETLARLGIQQPLVYRTNALLCMPPQGKPLSPKDLRACAPRLHEELHRCTGKKVILCVGASAATAVRGKKGTMGDLSGRSEWSEEYGCWLTFAYHPAAVLRTPELYEDFAWGVKCAVEQLAAPNGPLPAQELTWGVPEDADTAGKWLADMCAGGERIVVCDLETTGLDPQNDRILEVGFRDGLDTQPTVIPAEYLKHPTVAFYLEKLLAHRDITWVFHNGKFDIQFLWRAGFDTARIDADTMLMHHALDERSGGEGGGFHDLKRCARKYLHVPAWEDEAHEQMKAGGGMDAVSPEVRRKYQAYDLEYTYQLYFALERELDCEPPSHAGYVTPREAHDRLVVPAANALAHIETRGVRVSYPRLKTLMAEYKERIAQGAEHCAVVAGSALEGFTGPFNPNSTQQVQRVLKAMGYPFTGSSDEASIHYLQRWDRDNGRPSNDFLDAVLDYRSLVHTKSTYLDGIAVRLARHSDLRLRGSFLLHGTTSGRLSSRDPNMQNIPADSVIKELFIAESGYQLVNADYSQLEVRVLYWYSRDQALLESLKSGDFHWDVARRVFVGATSEMLSARNNLAELEQVAKRYTMFWDFHKRQQTVERTDDPEELYGWLKKRVRRQAKYVTFGTMYGEGAVALSSPEKGMGVRVQDAEAALQMWYQAYPKARGWLVGQATHARNYRWVESYSGRRRRFPYPPSMGTHIANEAMNHPIQSMASDVCLLALTQLEHDLVERDLGAPLLAVHDSILFELRTSRLEEAMALVRERMTGVVVDDDIVFDIDMKAGVNWAQCA